MRLFQVGIVWLLLFSLSAMARDVPASKDKGLSHLIAFGRILAEREKPEIFSIKLFVEEYYGDCQNPGKDCPQSHLYIATSESFSNEKLYDLGFSYQWKFIKWKTFPDREKYDPENFMAELIVQKKVDEHGKFVERPVIIRITPAGLTIK